MDILIDCGAWTLHKRVEKGDKNAIGIGIPEYCKWLKENKDLYTNYASFDVIHNGKATYENWLEMKKHGLNPMPVYHASTDVKYLHKYLDSGATHIAVGGIAFLGMKYRLANFDNLWANHLTDTKGYPIVKVHSFGLTALNFLLRYPWYSADSSSWAFIARHGGLFIARKVNGKFDFTVEHYKRNVSTRAPHKKSIPHIRFKGKVEEAMLREYLAFIGTPYGKSLFRPHKPGEVLAENESLWKHKVGKHETTQVEIIVEKGVINSTDMRDEANIKFFILTAEALPKYPWPFKNVHTKRRTFL
jgi:hypothetical protein